MKNYSGPTITPDSAGDPDLVIASQMARENFRYFWREVFWDSRRIVSGLDSSIIKAAFLDQKKPHPSGPEYMWMDDVSFDGITLRGVLCNSPNWTRCVKEGEIIALPFQHLVDWMYVVEDECYGAYSVDVVRGKMNKKNRREHDEAWGIKFPVPGNVRLFPKDWEVKVKNKGIMDHAMAANFARKLHDYLAEDPRRVDEKDDSDFTLLQAYAMAGSPLCVEAILSHGANKMTKTAGGLTAMDLASQLGWTDVISLLA